MRTVISEMELGNYRMLQLSEDDSCFTGFKTCRINGRKYKIERRNPSNRTITVKAKKTLLGGSVSFEY